MSVATLGVAAEGEECHDIAARTFHAKLSTLGKISCGSRFAFRRLPADGARGLVRFGEVRADAFTAEGVVATRQLDRVVGHFHADCAIVVV